MTRKTLFFCAYFICVLLIGGCNKQTDVTQNNPEESEFYEIYRALYLVTNGLEYPPNRAVMEICRNNIQESCYRTVSRVLEAKSTIITAKSESLLDITLSTIESYCNFGLQERSFSDDLCGGSITALYFFNSSADDKEIIARLDRLNQKTLEQVLYTKRAWYHNRSDNSIWADFFARHFYGDFLELLMDRLHAEDVAPFGLMLLEGP